MNRQRIDRLRRERTLPRSELRTLLTTLTREEEEYLYESASAVRHLHYGRDVYLRGLIEFTNYCRNDCLYCGIRRSNRGAIRYRLSQEEILDCCGKGYRLGFRTFVLQGGEDPFYTDEKICRIVSEIRARHPDCAVTLSVGERPRESYEAFFRAGAERYLLRHETIDPTHYALLHPPELTIENRRRCLEDLRQIGFQVGCGMMVGSPYQTVDHLLDDLFFMQSFRPHMIGIGPFIPHADTPFKDMPKGTMEDTLHLLAVIRLMHPRVLLPATTALGTIHPLGREMGIRAGANVVMPNLSPAGVRDKYMLYDGKICTGDEAAECRRCMELRMEKIGYHVVVSRGDSLVTERNRMSWEEKILKVEPYVAGEQPKEKDIIKLNTNECPYPPAPGVEAAVRELAAETDRLRLYPDMDATPLVQALAAQYGVGEEQIFVGVGSDDVLALCFLTFFSSATGQQPLLFPDITYSFYDVWANLYRIPFETKPLREDFSIDPADYIPALSGQPNAGVIFPNPNAPTGLELAHGEVERIVAGNPDSIVIVDEAYVDFGAQSALPLLHRYENLLVVQTFSKSRAMAGARVGFAIGNEKLIRYLKDVKFSFNSYTMNLPSIRIGTASAKDAAWFQETTGKIIATRERFKEELKKLGFVFPDSRSNFVFAKHPAFSGADLQAKLRERKIIVRHFHKPGISDYLRITIGTDEQMDKVVEALREILKESTRK